MFIKQKLFFFGADEADGFCWLFSTAFSIVKGSWEKTANDYLAPTEY